MNGPLPLSIDCGSLIIEGVSLAGLETAFRVRSLGIALDIGRCPAPLIGVSQLFLSHAHIDHAVGLPLHLAQRSLQGLPPPRVFVPAEIETRLRSVLDAHAELEEMRYDVELIAMQPGDRHLLRRDLSVVALEAYHRVPARGWSFRSLRHRLRDRYRGLSGSEIEVARKRGEEITEAIERPLLVYSGDTDARFLANEEAMTSDILMIECTFVAPGDRERAAAYGHIHFDDVIGNAAAFRNRLVVLYHFSLRYSPAEIHSMIRERCPDVLRERLRLALPEPFTRIDLQTEER